MSEVSKNRRFWVLWGSGLLLVCLLSAWFAAQMLAKHEIEQAAERLQLLNTLRKQALHSYFETASTELAFWSLNSELQEQQLALSKSWKAFARHDDPQIALRVLYIVRNPHASTERRKLVDAGDGSEYSRVHAELHPLARRFVEERGYYDFFLISPDGDVMYSVEKEEDFATNLKDGAWRDTGLADVYQRALALSLDDAIVLSDLESYGPSAGSPAIFMARAMKSSDGEVLGVLALQLPIDSIRDIMQFDAGMGASGETYLVGEDRLMRSDSRFSEKSTILKVSVTTEAVERALNGETGFMIMPDYRGINVLSAYDNEQFDSFRWAILAEIDEQEVLDNAAQRWPELGGFVLFLFGLGLGSLWFIRSGDGMPLDDVDPTIAMDNDTPDLPG